MGVPDFWEEHFAKAWAGLFQVVPDTSEHSILHLFWSNSRPPPPPPPISKSNKNVKRLYFWTTFKQFHHFFPLPILGLSFKFYNALSLSGHYRNYICQNFVFKTYAYPKWSRKTLGGSTWPPPPPPPPWYKKGYQCKRQLQSINLIDCPLFRML